VADGAPGGDQGGCGAARRAGTDRSGGHRRDLLRPTPLAADTDGRWRLVEPWDTGFVDLSGVQGCWVDGRTCAAVAGWLAARPQSWRDAVRIVAIDPSAPYAAAVRQLPQTSDSR
jgi:transposase